MKERERLRGREGSRRSRGGRENVFSSSLFSFHPFLCLLSNSCERERLEKGTASIVKKRKKQEEMRMKKNRDEFVNTLGEKHTKNTKQVLSLFLLLHFPASPR